MRVAVDHEKCQSYRRCTAVAPEVFGIGGDSKAEVLNPHGADDAVVLKAAKSCPYRAITVNDETTSEQLWPRA